MALLYYQHSSRLQQMKDDASCWWCLFDSYHDSRVLVGASSSAQRSLTSNSDNAERYSVVAGRVHRLSDRRHTR